MAKKGGEQDSEMSLCGCCKELHPKKRRKKCSNIQDTVGDDSIPPLALIPGYGQPSPQLPGTLQSLHHSNILLSSHGALQSPSPNIIVTNNHTHLPVKDEIVPADPHPLGDSEAINTIDIGGGNALSDSKTNTSDGSSTKSNLESLSASTSESKNLDGGDDGDDASHMATLLIDAELGNVIATLEIGYSATLDEAVHLNTARRVCKSGLSVESATFNTMKAFYLHLEMNLGSNVFKKLHITFCTLPFPLLKVIQPKIYHLLGLETVNIDCCCNSCICYTGSYTDLSKCLICNTPRATSNGKAASEFIYVKLIPQLQALYAPQESAHHM
ncbi:hypothetical protein FRB99_003974 [Tulasnella sp. 403]|nr:hypothetical protein FRB99_003974 [Tulasnella sp. 403]